MKQNFKLTKDQQTLVEKNLSIVHWVIVNNIHVNPGICGLEYGDLFQEGCLWLCKRSSIESSSEVVYESEPSSEEVVLDKLPLMDVIENGALLEALQKLNERERQIFLARTLEEEDFETLGVKFELSYKGAAALYYRTIQKIRKSIEGGDKR